MKICLSVKSRTIFAFDTISEFKEISLQTTSNAREMQERFVFLFGKLHVYDKYLSARFNFIKYYII